MLALNGGSEWVSKLELASRGPQKAIAPEKDFNSFFLLSIPSIQNKVSNHYYRHHDA